MDLIERSSIKENWLPGRIIQQAVGKNCPIESGKMTKDLALITEIENPTTLNSLEFIQAIRKTLEGML